MRLLGSFLMMLLFSFASFAQTAPKFVSVYGNFEVALPETPNLSRSMRNSEPPDKGVGAISAWEYKGVVFTILYLDPLDDDAFTDQKLAAAVAENDKRVRDIVKQYGGTIEIESDFDAGGNRGRQFVARLGDGRMITRNLQVGRRSYSLQAVVRGNADASVAFEVLRSFRIIDGRSILRARFDSLAPVSLSRRGMPKTPKSDLELAGVKGAARSIVEENEDLSGTGPAQGRILNAEYFYDSDGRLVRENICDVKGLPLRASVYGMAAGRLAVRSGTTAGRAKKPFDFTITNSFDPLGRVLESKYFDPAGNIADRIVNEYRDKTSVALYYNAEGTLRARVESKYDSEDRVVEMTTKTFKPEIAEVTVRFRYDKFDSRGNWTRRTMLAIGEENEKSVETPVAATFRTISYF